MVVAVRPFGQLGLGRISADCNQISGFQHIAYKCNYCNCDHYTHLVIAAAAVLLPAHIFFCDFLVKE